MVWAIVNSWSCFCWLYRASPSSCKEDNQSDFDIDYLVMSMGSFLVLWKRVLVTTSLFSWQNSVSLCPVSFCTPRPNLPVTPIISWLPTLHSSPLWWKGHLFWVLVLEGLVGLHRTIQIQRFWCYCLGQNLGLLWIWPMHSLGKTLLDFALLHFVLQGQTCLLLQVSLDFLLLQSHMMKRKSFFGVSSRRSCRSS